TITVALHKHEMDRQLRDRERWLSTALRSIGEGVVATDALGNVNLINPTAERLTGWTQVEAVGRSAYDVVVLVDAQTLQPLEHPLGQALHGRAPVRLERDVLIVSRSGQPVGVDASSSRICDAEGKVLGAIVVLRDLGERRRLEAPLQVPDRVAGLGVMTA